VARLLLAATNPGIELWDPNTDWRYGGFLTRYQIVRTPSEHTLILHGLDFQAELSRRLDRPAASLAAWDAPVTPVSSSITTAARTLVINNAGPSAPAIRRIPNLTIGPNPGAGFIVDREPNGQPLLERFKDWFTDFTHTAQLRLLRTITDTGDTPSLHFSTPARPVATRLSLSPGSASLGTFRTSEEAAGATEIAVLTGFENMSGYRDTRWGVTFGPSGVVIGATTGTPTDWRWHRSEAFFARPGLGEDGDTDVVDQEISNLAVENDATRSVSFSGVEVDGYGRDIDVGWLVNAAIDPTLDESGEASYVQLPVVASTITFLPQEGWRRTVDVGAEVLSDGPAAIYDRLARLTRRIRDIERNL
jgi:hypothetical protein